MMDSTLKAEIMEQDAYKFELMQNFLQLFASNEHFQSLALELGEFWRTDQGENEQYKGLMSQLDLSIALEETLKEIAGIEAFKREIITQERL